MGGAGYALVAALLCAPAQERIIQVTAKRFEFSPAVIDAGTYDFHCSLFCGSGHEDMEGRIVVKP